MPENVKRLFRSREHRMIAGVCGGVGEYFDIDPVVIRLIFAVATILGWGSTVVIYIIAWILMPENW